METHIKDRFQRPLKDLRISVTDRCNFRCTYCMPSDVFGPDFPFLQKEEILSNQEIIRLAKIFSSFGVEKIRITGGEPLLRSDLTELVGSLNAIEGIKYLALTTNGILLPKYAQSLKNAGLQRVNISLDALDDELFQKINGRHVKTKPVLKGIRAAKDAGLEVKVNMVVKKGLNDDQILPMVNYFKQEGITLRFIEFMDVGSTNGWSFKNVISKKEIYEMIKVHYELEPVKPLHYGEVAKRYRYKGTNTEVGFISSVSEAFCHDCTRARLSTDGQLFTCLFSSKGYSLRELLLDDASDEEISSYIASIWHERTDRYSEERTEESAKAKKIEMSYIGG